MCANQEKSFVNITLTEKLKKNLLDTLNENLRHPNGQILNGFITIEKGNSAETSLEIVEGMQFDRGYLSKYFTDRKIMKAEFQDCKLLLVDKIIKKHEGCV